MALLILLFAGCTQTAVVAPTPETITIAGSTEMGPVLNELTAAYSKRYPNVLFSVQGGGSILGERWLESGRVDLAASTSFPNEDEPSTTLLRIPIGLDGVAVVVHPDNPVAELTLAQLRNLYSGQSLDWQDVGGAGGEVLLVSREDGSATRMLFEARVMDEEGVTLTAVVMPTSEDVVDYVSRRPNAIGYVSQAYLIGSEGVDGTGQADAARAQEPARVHIVAVESRLPSKEEIAAQSYYLSRPVFLLRRPEDTVRLQPFIDFVLSPAGQEIVARYHVAIR